MRSNQLIELLVKDCNYSFIHLYTFFLVSLISLTRFWCAMFFLMLISLGLDSAMGGLEACICGLMDEFPNWFKRRKISREIFTGIVIFLSFLISLVNITQVRRNSLKKNLTKQVYTYTIELRECVNGVCVCCL